MSKYTTEVRYICEVAANKNESEGYDSINDILEVAAPKVFDFNFPIFDENYRLPLEIKILRYYYTREICEETVGLWKLRLENKMNEIMPYYNQLYKSELLEFNPFYDVNLTRDSNRQNDGTETSQNTRQGIQDTNEILHSSGTDKRTGTNTNDVTNSSDSTRHDSGSNQVDETSHNERNNTEKNVTDSTRDETVDTTNQTTTKDTGEVDKTNSAWRLYSDTPQGGLEGIRHAEDDVANMAYLTNATHDTGDEHTTTSATGNSNSTGKQTTNASDNVTANLTQNETEDGTRTEKGKHDDFETITQTGRENGNQKFDENREHDSFETNKVTNNLNQTDNGKNTITNTEDFIEHVKGKQGSASYSRMLTEFRETFLNIDKMIIEELSTLFFGLWA